MTTGQFLLTLFSAVLVCGGLSAAARPDGLLEGVYKWVMLHYIGAHPRIPKWIAYPTILCSTCMGSFWGIVSLLLCRWLLHIPWSWELVGWGFIVVCGTAFCNLLLWTWITTQESIRKHGHALRDQIRHPGESQGPVPQ